MARCAVCREEFTPKALCPRCGYENAKLEEINQVVGYFGNFWGALSFLLIFPSLFMLMPGIFLLVDQVLQPVVSITVGAPIALLIVLITTFYMFNLSVPLHHYTLTQQFKEKRGRSIAILALVFFVVAIFLLFILAFILTNKGEIVGPEGYADMEEYGKLTYGGTWHMLLKLTMTGFFVFTFVFLALSAGLMAAYLCGRYIDERRPDPIFLNEQLLLKVVLKDVREHLKTDRSTPGKKPSAKAGTNSEDLSLSGMKRLEDGGISLTVQHVGELVDRAGVKIREDKTWYVEADCWGHLRKVEEKSLRVSQITEAAAAPPAQEPKTAKEPQPVQSEGVLAQIGKLLGPRPHLRVHKFEYLKDGGVILTLGL